MNERVLVVFVSVALLPIDRIEGSCPTNDNRPGITEKISGGAPAPCDRYPYVASIRNDASSHACGGVLVHPQYVLTTATCLVKLRSRSLEINLGGYKINEAVEVRRGTPMIRDGFRSGEALNGNDIALLKLDQRSGIQPAKLPNRSFSPGEEVTAIGWGRMSVRGAFAPVLNHRTRLPIIGKEQCKKVNGFNRLGSLLCAGTDVATCLGDEGSALVKTGGRPGNDVLVGITLDMKGFNLDCGIDNKAGVFTDVRAHMRWINGKI